jgi:tetratricopeptide (TPR) repeat protein
MAQKKNKYQKNIKQSASPSGKQSSKIKKEPAYLSSHNNDKNIRLYALLIVVITLVTYLISLTNGFVANWDDGGYILENKVIRALNATNLKIIFTQYANANYHPLTTLTNAIEYSMVGASPFLYHFNNLILHLANVLLVFWFTHLLSKRIEVPVVVALLFESTRCMWNLLPGPQKEKDLLYTFFFIASLISYQYYITEKTKKQKYFYLSLILFLLSLFSKSAAVPLPLVLLLLDYYKKRKFTIPVIIEKLPFFALSMIFGIVAIYSQQSAGALQYYNPVFSYGERIFISSYAVMVYLVKLFLPLQLSTMYPYPDRNEGMLPMLFYVSFVVVLVLAFLIFLSRKKNRDIVFGSLFFLFTIALVLQVLPVGGAMLSERYTYVPYIGLFFIIGKTFCYVADSKSKAYSQLKSLLIGVFVVFSAIFCYLTFERIQIWKNGEILFTDVINKYPNLAFAYNNRGYLYYTYNKDYEKALADYNKSISIDTTFHRAYSNRGVLYYNTNRVELAIPDFTNAIKYDKTNTDAWIGRANSYSTLKKFDLSIPDYNAYIALKSDDEKAYLWRGTAELNLKRFDEALNDLNKAISMNPADDECYYWRGLVYNQKNDFQSAINDLNKSISMKPDKAELYSWRGLVYYNLKSYNNAIDDLSRAIIMNPQDAAAFVNRSHVYFDMKRYKEAWDDINSAGKLGFPLDKNYFLQLQGLVR